MEQIRSIIVLTGFCHCGKRADYRVQTTNNNPPPGFISGGTMSRDYCNEHMPREATALIDNMLRL